MFTFIWIVEQTAVDSAQALCYNGARMTKGVTAEPCASDFVLEKRGFRLREQAAFSASV